MSDLKTYIICIASDPVIHDRTRTADVSADFIPADATPPDVNSQEAIHHLNTAWLEIDLAAGRPLPRAHETYLLTIKQTDLTYNTGDGYLIRNANRYRRILAKPNGNERQCRAAWLLQALGVAA